MGWDVTQVGSNITTRAFIEYYIRRSYAGVYESVKISEGANVDGQKPFYVALKKLEDNSVFACVILTQRKNGQVFTKVIGESEQPFFYEASAKFLEVLSPTTHIGSLQWRADCLNNFISTKILKGVS
jgi:hypothetical protein